MIQARAITKHYVVGGSTLDVLTGIDLDIMKGEILAIVGESGAGKSTLLHILGMLDRPNGGTISLNGDDITGKTDSELAAYRNRKVGFVFQFHHLLPEFNALENVLMPALINGKFNTQSVSRAEKLLDHVGLSQRIKHRPGELSGGELQRVAVARALMNEPAIVLADEPSGNLDHRNSEMLHDLLWGLARENGYTFVIVTHDMVLAERADRIVQLDDGIAKEIKKENLNELFRSQRV
ncbi:ABC transporter ATP-binding protein [bacterium]|nr:ABC transporter ATP-binding protein [bacterium]